MNILKNNRCLINRSIFLLLFLLPLMMSAQNVTIKGKAPDYEGRQISFYTYKEPVLHQKMFLAETNVGKEGNFSVSFTVSHTVEVYSDLEKFTGSLIVEPNKSYQITLPPFSPRTSFEAKSPYFKATLYWFGLPQAEKTDLNFQVRAFINDYHYNVNRHTSALRNISREKVSEIVLILEQKYSANTNEFFSTLRKYNYADLENSANPGQSDLVISKYFSRQPVQIQNPAYQKTFEAIFRDFLRKQTQDYKNKDIAQYVNSGNYEGLISFFTKKGYRKDVAELVILKGLYDGFHTGGFNKQGILRALDQAQNSISVNYKPVVRSLKEMLTRLAVKTTAPTFQLKNSNNEIVSSEKYRGRYVYLNFIRSNSPESRFELDTLVHLEKKLRQVLSVVSIATDDKFESAVRLWKEKGYTWELLNGSGNKKLIENYNAETVPVFYLLDPAGNLILSPAASPSHEFEPVFLKIFRENKSGGN